MNLSFERAAGSCFGASCACACIPDSYGGENWISCPAWGCGSTDIGPNPGGSLNMGNTVPTNGNNYMSMECSGGPGGLGEGNSLTFCPDAQLQAGTEYCFEIDLITRTSDGFVCPPFTFNCAGVSRLVIYGSATPCQMTQVLWTSPVLTGSWQTYAFCFIPTANWGVMSFRVLNPVSGLSAIGLDNLVPTQGDFFLEDCVLPVSWLAYEATCTSIGRRVAWSVASQTNNERFEVERSMDLIDWSLVATVPGAGTVAYPMSYEVIDVADQMQWMSQLLYYRVKQVDISGRSSYSSAFASQCEPVVFPNPATDQVTIILPAPGTDVAVFDAIGRLVWSGMPETTFHRLDVSRWAAGMYAVRLSRSGRYLDAGVFIKQ